MSYTPTEWKNGDTITASAMNKIENGIANAGGGDYDLIITYDMINTPNTCTVTHGDILDCEDKMDNGEIIKGICIVKKAWSWIPSGSNTNREIEYLPLVIMRGTYRNIFFGGSSVSTDGNAVFTTGVTIQYNGSTGSITNYVYLSSVAV